jgi:hypothetical protein
MIIEKNESQQKSQSLNSNVISVGVIGMRGNSTSSPLNFPFKIIASIMYIQFFTESLAPFQNGGGLMFHKIMMSTSIFNVRTFGGMSNKSSKFKNSVGLCSKCNTSATQHTEYFLHINILYRDQK